MRFTFLAPIAVMVGVLGVPVTGSAASPEPSLAPVPGSPALAAPGAVSIPGLVLAPDARIGADPSLRDPIQPTGRVVAADTKRAADLDDELRPVRLQIWFPDGIAGPGDTVRFHVRITNQGMRTIRLYCPGFNLRGWTLSLFPDVPARTVEDELNRLVFGIQGPGLFTLRITPRAGDNPACEGRPVAARFPLGPGRALDVTADALLVAPYGAQALPGGSLHIASGVQWTPKGGGPQDGGALGGSADITIEGPDWPWANPVTVVDAIDAIPEVRALIARPVGFRVDDVSVDVVLARLPGWSLPAGFDPSQLLAWRLVPEPADPEDGATPVSILVDPWTAQVIAVLPG